MKNTIKVTNLKKISHAKRFDLFTLLVTNTKDIHAEAALHIVHTIANSSKSFVSAKKAILEKAFIINAYTEKKVA